MKNLLLFLTFVFFNFPTFAEDKAPADHAGFDHNRWNQIMKLVDGEIKTIINDKIKYFFIDEASIANILENNDQ